MPRVEEDEMFQAVRTSAACITVMNARQRNAMPADAFWRTTGRRHTVLESNFQGETE